jgi:hypothetical protein
MTTINMNNKIRIDTISQPTCKRIEMLLFMDVVLSKEMAMKSNTTTSFGF